MEVIFMRKRKRKKIKSLYEFSKKVVIAIVIVWFLTCLYGMALTFFKPESNVQPILDYVGQPMTVAVIFYLGKSAFENKAKIQKDIPYVGPPTPPNIGDE